MACPAVMDSSTTPASSLPLAEVTMDPSTKSLLETEGFGGSGGVSFFDCRPLTDLGGAEAAAVDSFLGFCDFVSGVCLLLSDGDWDWRVLEPPADLGLSFLTPLITS